MKLQYSIFISGIICFLTPIIKAQDIQLRYNNKTQTIKAETFVEVTIPVPDREPCSICPVNDISGKIISYQHGILKLEVHESNEIIVEKDVSIGVASKNYFKENKIYTILEIPKERILAITKKGKKRVNEYTAGDVVAMTLTVLLVGQLTAIPFAEENTDALLALVGSEILIAATLGSVSKQKTFITHEHCPLKSEGNKKKVWILE